MQQVSASNGIVPLRLHRNIVMRIDKWMDDLRFYILCNSVSVISGRWEVDNERLYAMELRLRLRRLRLDRGSNSIR